MKKLLSLVALATILFSCSENEGLIPDFALLPINISVGNQTRANDTTYENNDEVGVYVVNYDGLTAGTLAESGNQVDNMKFTYSDGIWTPDEVVYWKDVITATDFYVYYPYISSPNISACVFSVQQDQSNEADFWASDFLWGKAIKVSPTPNAVPIQTNHSLSRILVDIKPGDGFTEEAWAAATKSVKICDVKTSATISLSTGVATAIGDNDEIVPFTTSTNGSTLSYKAMMVPQDVAESSKLVVVTVDGVEYIYRKGYTFKANTEHKFTVKVNKSAISSSVDITIGEWLIDDTINEGSAEEDANGGVDDSKPQWRVRTVVGEVNDKKEAEIKDGPFGDCGNIMNAATFTADPLNPLHVYVSSDLYTGGTTNGVGARSDIRLIDFEKKEVTTIFNASYFNQSRIRGVKFTSDDEHNMLVAMESGNPSVILVKRKEPGMTGAEAFKNQPWDGLSYTSLCNGMDVHPKSGSVFFNSYGDGGFYKFPDHTINPGDDIYSCVGYPSDDDKHKSQRMFLHGERYMEMRCEIHPDGNYMLILQINGGSYIGKSMYNEATDTFEMMSGYVGNHTTLGGGRGYVDDVGTSAKTNSPRQIAWVKNPEYEGQTDQYDAYFTDRSNHCIRKITPQGVVSTFAGRGSGTTNPWGFADGRAIGEALFDCPCGLYYNEERNVFWVGDTNNLRIREIYFE